MESIDLIPMDGEVGKITRRAEEFRDLPEALQRNLQTFLTLTMDALSIVHQKVKSSMAAEATRQMVNNNIPIHIRQNYDTHVLIFCRHWSPCAKSRGRSSSSRAS